MANVSESAAGDPLVLYLTGEIDLTTTHVLVSAVDSAIDRGARSVAFDLGGVTFFGSSGILSLLHARDRLTATGVSMTITEMSRPVRRAMAAAGVLEPFETAATV
jgi:anti-sigma B factor antagonist